MSAAAAGDGGDERRNDRAPAENPTKTATNSRKRSNENPNEGEPNAKRYACRFCNQVFEKSQALGGHMNRHRPDREKETFQKAHALVRKVQNQHLVASHAWNLFAGGPAATAIAQNPSGLASGITSPLQALGARPSLNFPPGLHYQHPMGPVHPNMLVPSNSVMQSSNHLQHNPGIPSNSVMHSSNNLQQNPHISSNSVMHSSNNNLQQNPNLPSNSVMHSSNNLQQNPGNLHWNQDRNLNLNAHRAPSNLRNRNEFGNSVGNNLHQNAQWNQDDNTNSNALRDLNNEPAAKTYHNDDLVDGIINSQSKRTQDSVPNPHYHSFE